jgi:hypothetical protein
MSDLPPSATELRTSLVARFAPRAEPIELAELSEAKRRAKSTLGILPHALAFGQLRDRRLKALLDILACGYLNLLTVIVSDPHTVLVDPTVLDFANAFCCHASIER